MMESTLHAPGWSRFLPYVVVVYSCRAETVSSVTAGKSWYVSPAAAAVAERELKLEVIPVSCLVPLDV